MPIVRTIRPPGAFCCAPNTARCERVSGSWRGSLALALKTADGYADSHRSGGAAIFRGALNRLRSIGAAHSGAGGQVAARRRKRRVGALTVRWGRDFRQGDGHHCRFCGARTRVSRLASSPSSLSQGEAMYDMLPMAGIGIRSPVRLTDPKSAKISAP